MHVGVDHPLTLIEADGTLLSPTQVAGVTVPITQHYSVLLHANQTANANGMYWMCAEIQSDMFMYVQPGQNLNIRGVIQYRSPLLPKQAFADHFVCRYSDG